MMRRDEPNLMMRAEPVDAFAATKPFAEPAPRPVDMARLWQALERRRKLFLAVAGGLFALVAIFTFVQRNSYTTSVRMIAGSANSDSSQVEPANAGGTPLSFLNAMLAARGMQTPETYIDLLLQPSIAQKVVDDLHLNASPQAVLLAVKAKPVPDTAIISMTATWNNPKISAAIANSWAKAFVAKEQQIISQQADALIATTNEQLPAAQAKAQAAQDELADYQQSVGIADLPTQTAAIVANESSLEAKQETAQMDEQQASASLAAVQRQLAQTPPTIVGQQSVAANPVQQAAQTDVARLQAALAQAEQQYTENHPTVIALKAQLAQAERSEKVAPKQVFAGQQTVPNPIYQSLQTQAAQLTAQIASAQAQIATSGKQIAAAAPTISGLPAKARRIAELQRNAKAAQDYYDGLKQKNGDAVIAKSTAVSDVTVTQTADPALAVVTPNRLLNLFIGLVLGIVLGLAAVFVVEFLDDRFRSGDDIRDRLGLPLLATIPLSDETSLARNEWLKPLSVESFHQLVASLRYSSEQSPRVISFTSPDRGDGKSTVVCNTARSMGNMGQRVLVIDADLRRPTIHTKFELLNDRGLSDVLVGVTSFDDAIRPAVEPGVSVLTSGTAAPNPIALLQSEAFDRVIREAVSRYDQVLIDAPALRPLVDGLVLGVKSDGVVLVVSSMNSNGRAVQDALQKLRSVGAINLLGVVLNATVPTAREFSPYYLGAGQSISLPAASE